MELTKIIENFMSKCKSNPSPQVGYISFLRYFFDHNKNIEKALMAEGVDIEFFEYIGSHWNVKDSVIFSRFKTMVGETSKIYRIPDDEYLLLIIIPFIDAGPLNNFIQKNVFFEAYASLTKIHIEKMMETARGNEGFSLDDSLSSMCKNISKEVALSKELYIEQDDITEKVINTFCRMKKRNVCLIGEPGVGKTACVENLARRINDGNVPEELKKCQIIQILPENVISGTKYRGEMEEKLTSLLDQIEKLDNVIVFIDEIHTILNSSEVSGSQSISDILKPRLTKAKFRFIGATTDKEFKIVEKDAAFSRRFSKVRIYEPSRDQSVKILHELRPVYEEYHNVIIDDDVLELAVDLSIAYNREAFLPDKAIDILDEAATFVKVNNKNNVSSNVIKNIISKKYDIPIEFLSKSANNKVCALDKEIKEKLYGQDDAVNAVSKVVRVAKAGLSNKNKPLGSFLFVGPTGVGKTELAKILADNLGMKLQRYDMSEYSERHTVSRLIGSPPGYVGYSEGGLLVDSIRKNPNSIILIDEVEKAHSAIHNLFLQILDYGIIKDAHGMEANFRNSIIIMTSNAGSTDLNGNTVGFASEAKRDVLVDKALKETFPPEFRNRLTIVKFNRLNQEISMMVARKALDIFCKTLQEKGIELTYGKNALEGVVKTGFSPEAGGRGIEKAVEDLKALIAIDILNDKFKDGSKCRLSYDSKTSVFSFSESVKKRTKVLYYQQ